jgi:hypothetical protein
VDALAPEAGTESGITTIERTSSDAGYATSGLSFKVIPVSLVGIERGLRIALQFLRSNTWSLAFESKQRPEGVKTAATMATIDELEVLYRYDWVVKSGCEKCGAGGVGRDWTR